MRSIVTALIFVVLFAGLFVTANFWVNWWWYDSAGYLSVLTTRYLAQGLAFVIGGLVPAIFFTVNWQLALRRSYAGGNRPADARPSRILRYPLWLLTAAVFVLSGIAAGGAWVEWLLFTAGRDFGVTDPIFGRDAGFYIFALPILAHVQAVAFSVLIVTTIVTALVYLVGFGLDGLDLRNPPLRLRTHVLALIGGLILLIGLGYLIANFELQYSTRGFTVGVGFTDAVITRWINFALFAVSVVAAIFLILNSFVRRLRLLVLVAGVWVLAVLIGLVLPPIVQQTLVDPSQLSREQPYIANNITLTRAAYDLSELTNQPLSGQGVPSPAALSPDSPTFDNIRLWDYRIVRDSFQQLRAFVPYYYFNDVDVDRYRIDGDLRQVLIAARELRFSGLQPNSQNWQNEHFTYTHGYGAVVSPVSEATASGLPIFWVGSIPPEDAGPLTITRPEIYFGETDQAWVAVNTNVGEISGLSGETVTTPYDGVAVGGIPVDNTLRRAILATFLGDRRVFLSSELRNESQLLIRRSISERVEAIAPFLSYEPDPYLVIADGRLVWVMDAYATSDRFPGATPVGSLNYIRNTVKVTIDAYSGETIFYRTGVADPITDAYGTIFRDLFRPITEAPATIAEHFRYPEQLFDIQSEVYSAYHVTDPVAFFNGEDRWEVAEEIVESPDSGEGSLQRMEAYYMTLPLQTGSESRFGLVRAFTPNQRENMSAWMAGGTTGDGTTQLLVYRFPRQTTVFGPQQIESLISQDPFISSQSTLLGQAGSRVIRGNLLVIPIDETMLYVQPLYLQATAGQGAPSELKFVIVATNEDVQMAETLAESLGALTASDSGAAAAAEIGTTPIRINASTAPEAVSIAEEALASYNRSQEALANGDWATYGEEQEHVSELLTELVGLGTPIAAPAAGEAPPATPVAP